MEEEAEDVENAVAAVLDKGYRTADIAERERETVGTDRMGDLIAQEIRNM
jgi:3-isopropylmalate dehydrogenase